MSLAHRRSVSGAVGAVLLVATLTPTPAVAVPAASAVGSGFALTLVSGTDRGGQPTTAHFDETTATIAVDSSTDLLTVSVRGGEALQTVDLTFVTAYDGALGPGHYPDAQRAFFAEPGHPGLSVGVDGAGCTTVAGQFDVLSLHRTAGFVDAGWLIFEQHCEVNGPPVWGELRFGLPAAGVRVAPAALQWPQGDSQVPPVAAGDRLTAVPVLARTSGAAVPYGGARLTGPGAGAYEIARDDCAGRAVDRVGCRVWVRYRPLSGGPQSAQLELTVNGAPRRVALDGPASSRSRGWSLVSDGRDPVGGGASYTFAPTGARVDGWGDRYRFDSGAVPAGSGTGSWSAAFEPDASQPLTVGRTYAVSRLVGVPGDAPAMDVRSPEHACSEVSGSFTVEQYELLPLGGLRQARISFVQYCDGSRDALEGTIRYGAVTDAVAPGPVTGLTVSRSGASATVAWTPPAGTARTVVRWEQSATRPARTPVAGRPGCTTSGGSCQLTGLGAGPLVVSAFAVDAAGNVGPLATATTGTAAAVASGTRSPATTPTADAAADARTRPARESVSGGPVDRPFTVALSGEVGDWVSQDVDWRVDQRTAFLEATVTEDALGLRVSTSTESMELDLVDDPAHAGPLGVGWAPRAVRDVQAAPGRPGLGVAFGSVQYLRGCNRLTGWYDVRELRVVGGVLERLWVVFEQHCDGAEAVAYGEIRVGSLPSTVAYPHVVHWPDHTYPGGRSDTATVRVSSAQPTTEVSAVRVTGPDAASYTVVDDGCTGRAPGAAGCDVTLRFAPPPGAPGPRQATLEVDTTAGVRRVELDGTAQLGTTQVLVDRSTSPGGGGTVEVWDARDSYPAVDVPVVVAGDAHGLAFGVDTGPGGDNRHGTFWPEHGDVLTAGPYPLGHAPREVLPGPRLEVDPASFSSCTTTDGWFTAADVTLDPVSGELTRADVEFAMTCNDSRTDWLTGRVQLHDRADVTPPGPVTGVQVVRDGTRLLLSWTSPAGDHARTVVRWHDAATRAPGDPSVGRRAYVGTGTSATLTGRPAGVPTVLSFFTVDATGNAGPPVVVRVV